MAAITIGRGLLRLWVVMSVCWVLVIGAITWSTLDWTKEWVPKPEAADDWGGVPVCPQPNPKDTQEVCYLEDTLSGRGVKQIKTGSVLAFAPPIVALVLGFAFSWVVRGFRHQQPRI